MGPPANPQRPLPAVAWQYVFGQNCDGRPPRRPLSFSIPSNGKHSGGASRAADSAARRAWLPRNKRCRMCPPRQGGSRADPRDREQIAAGIPCTTEGNRPLRKNAITYCIATGCVKRMGRDSNPRRTLALSSFQDCRLRPLGHPSGRFILTGDWGWAGKVRSTLDHGPAVVPRRGAISRRGSTPSRKHKPHRARN